MKASIHASQYNGRSFVVVLRAALLLLPGLASLITTGGLRAQEPAVRVEMFSFRSDGYVSIENTRGSTRVETWAKEKVHVIAEKKTPTGSPLVSSELVLSSDDNKIHIECKQAAEPGRINLTVFIPRSSHLQVTGGESPVEVTGSVASAVIETTGGNIEYRLPPSDDARVVMHSARGSVRSTLKLTSYDRASMRSIQGRLGRGNAPIILNSQSGDISLQPASAAPAMAVVIDLPQTTSARRPAPQKPDRQAGGQTPPQVATRDIDQADQDDPNSIAMPPSQQTQRPAGSRPSDSQVIISQDGSSQQSTTAGRDGPLSGQRQETRNSSGSIGVGVRVIRPDSPAGRADNSQPRTSMPDNSYGDPSTKQRIPDPSYDRNDQDKDIRYAPSTAPHSRPAPDSSSGTVPNRPRDSASRPGSDGRQGSSAGDNHVGDSPGEIAHAGRPSNAPPVLRRDSVSEPGASAGTASPSSNNSGGEESIVLKTSLVSLNVSVTNRSGKSLPDLTRDDFQVYENNEPQRLEFFAPATAPFNLVLLLDLSGSISDKLDVVKSAAMRFIDLIGPQDKVAVLTFTRQVQVVSEFTTDRNLLRQRIDAITEAQGGTAFYEAMWFALTKMLERHQGQRNAIVVMTDGVDNSLEWFRYAPTRVSFEQLAERIKESDVIAFPIYLDTEEEEVWERLTGTPMSYEMARSQLETIAELTGGQMYKARRIKDLSRVYGEVAAALRTIYSLGYYPSNQDRDGSFRRVRVKVSRAEAAVRSRRGYYAK